MPVGARLWSGPSATRARSAASVPRVNHPPGKCEDSPSCPPMWLRDILRHLTEKLIRSRLTNTTCDRSSCRSFSESLQRSEVPVWIHFGICCLFDFSKATSLLLRTHHRDELVGRDTEDDGRRRAASEHPPELVPQKFHGA